MKPRIPVVKDEPIKEKKIKKRTTKVRKAKSTCKKILRIRCPICLNNLDDKSVVATKCGHVFCRSCLQKALLLKHSCPTCRRKLTLSQGYHTLYLDSNVYDDCMDVNTYGQ